METKNPTAQPVAASNVDAKQATEIQNYTPTYKVKPEFKATVLKAIGDAPYGQIAGIIKAIDVPTLDHQSLTQIINILVLLKKSQK